MLFKMHLGKRLHMKQCQKPPKKSQNHHKRQLSWRNIALDLFKKERLSIFCLKDFNE